MKTIELTKEQAQMLEVHARNCVQHHRNRLAEYNRRFPRPNAKQRVWIRKRLAMLEMATNAQSKLEACTS